MGLKYKGKIEDDFDVVNKKYADTKQRKLIYSKTEPTDAVEGDLWGYDVRNVSITNEGICFTALANNSKLGYAIMTGKGDVNVEYSYDRENWSSWDGTDLNLNNINDKVYIRNTKTTYNYESGGIYFTMSGSLSVSGDCTCMINKAELTPYCFYGMFYQCSALVSASGLQLPSMNLANACYYVMFMGCSNLTSVPTLPATVMANHCYSSMFAGCSSLTTPPALSATALAEDCYGGMFEGCTNLTTAPALPATVMAKDCYNTMFYDCSNLLAAPELPATDLTGKLGCYKLMFNGCSSLSYIKILYTGVFSIDNQFDSWVIGVSATGDFYYNGTDTESRSGSSIPKGWTVHTF